MHVRVAHFGELAEPDQAVAEIRRQIDSGAPPPGLEGVKRLLMLVDRQHGRGIVLNFFETEEDMRRGDEALNAMNPEGGARRTSVEMYEVGIDQQF